jgi:hypothetical protein
MANQQHQGYTPHAFSDRTVFMPAALEINSATGLPSVTAIVQVPTVLAKQSPVGAQGN